MVAMKLRDQLTITPVPPDQLLEGVDARVEWIVIGDADIALLEIFFRDGIWMTCAGMEQQCDDEEWACC